MGYSYSCCKWPSLHDHQDRDLPYHLIKGRDLKGIPLMRLILPDQTHHGYVWHKGINIDPLPFNPSGRGRGGGLYFTSARHILRYIHNKNVANWYIGIVSVDDDEDVWYSDGDFKAHTVTLDRLTKISDLSDKECYDLATHSCTEKVEPYDPERHLELWYQLAKESRYLSCIMLCQNQHLELCKQMIHWSHTYFPFFLIQDNKLCERAVSLNGLLLEHVSNQNIRLCMIAFQQNKDALNYIKDHSIVHKLLAEDGMLLKHIKYANRTKEMTDIAIAQNIRAFTYARQDYVASDTPISSQLI